MIDESCNLLLVSGKMIQAQTLKAGYTILGLAGTMPVSMFCRSAWTEKVKEAIVITAGGHSITVSADARMGIGEKSIYGRRADAIQANTEVRVFDGIPHLVTVESVERLEGSFRMYEYTFDGRASYIIVNGFLIR